MSREGDSPMAPDSPVESSQSSDDGVYPSNNNKLTDDAGQSRANQHTVTTVNLMGVPIVALNLDGQERLCLAQISSTLLKQFSYNEIHNRRVALGITCVQCTPVQLEILRRAGAMPISSRRCGMISKREAERLCKSFLTDNAPPKLPESFAFEVLHKCAWGCRGSFTPSRYNSSRAKCIRCTYCNLFFSPNKFIFHSHRLPESTYVQPDAANFNSWRRHLYLADANSSDELLHAWEDVKAMFNGGSRKRIMSGTQSTLSSSHGGRSELDIAGPEPKLSRPSTTLAADPLVPNLNPVPPHHSGSLGGQFGSAGSLLGYAPQYFAGRTLADSGGAFPYLGSGLGAFPFLPSTQAAAAAALLANHGQLFSSLQSFGLVPVTSASTPFGVNFALRSPAPEGSLKSPEIAEAKNEEACATSAILAVPEPGPAPPAAPKISSFHSMAEMTRNNSSKSDSDIKQSISNNSPPEAREPAEKDSSSTRGIKLTELSKEELEKILLAEMEAKKKLERELQCLQKGSEN